MVILNYIFILLFATTVVIAQKSAAAKPLEVVSVCDVLNNRKFYNDKIVALVGQYWGGYHGLSLIEGCINQVKTGDYVWENAIRMKYDSSSSTAFADGITFDESTAEKKIAEMKRRLQPTDEKVLWCVVFGRIETREELEISFALDGKSINPLGYGHLGGSPAQVVYKQNDVKFLRDK